MTVAAGASLVALDTREGVDPGPPLDVPVSSVGCISGLMLYKAMKVVVEISYLGNSNKGGSLHDQHTCNVLKDLFAYLNGIVTEREET